MKEFFLHCAPVPLQLQHSVLNTWNITSYGLLDNHRNDTILYTIDQFHYIVALLITFELVESIYSILIGGNIRCLFLKKVVPENANKQEYEAELKKLHANVIDANVLGRNGLFYPVEIRYKYKIETLAWLLFPSEKTAEKAYGELQKAKLKGQPLVVDFCGEKAKLNKSPSKQQATGIKYFRFRFSNQCFVLPF